MSKKNYKNTLALPKTKFPMEAKLVQREPEIRKRWDEMDIYGKIVAARKGKPKWVLHDGPPYANGDVHVGTGQNKVLKDFVVKYRTMRGFYSPFVPGWDCHGLPIEHKVMKDLLAKGAVPPKPEVRRLCQEFAERYIDIQRGQFKSLGCFGDWQNPYLTLTPIYEVSVLEVFEEMFKKGHIYKGQKAVHWCIHDKTALAEAEIEYKDLPSSSIWLVFEAEEADLFVWTTTPWTLPGDVAVTAHPELEYAVVEYEHPKKGRRKGILGRPLVEKLTPIYNIIKQVATVKGKDLEGRKYRHPLFGNECPVVLDTYVKLDEGTGLVHTAPGHGAEDFETGLRYKLPVVCPVDEAGKMTEEAGKYKGLTVWKANPEIEKDLLAAGTIVKREEMTHSYPCCWRCKNAVIFRATEQWFIAVDKNEGRARALEAVSKTNWVPSWGEVRIQRMLEQLVLSEKTLEATKKLFEEKGANGWFTTEPKDFLPADTACPKCGAKEFRKEEDIFDVWFESAASHRAVSMKHPELQFPVELYLEGTDQHRGWFQVSLLSSMFSNGQAPFKTVVTHGFLTDARTGAKLSKSGFLIPVHEVAEKMGTEILRLWIASIDFTDDLPMSWEILKSRGDPYKKIRNTFRYLLANLHDFDPAKDAAAEFTPLDAWARGELSQLVAQVTDAFEKHEYHRAYRLLYEFCAVTMSALYLDILKDRLYTLAPADPARRSAQTVLHETLQALVRMFAPILAHTMEEVWSHLPGAEEESVHLALWPEPSGAQVDPKWDAIWKVRSAAYREIEKLRAAGSVGKSLESRVIVAAKDDAAKEALAWLGDGLAEVLIVSEVE
ncbi:MAG: isoleucine--tRNA ligase, partial [Planctomycetota bacterium]